MKTLNELIIELLKLQSQGKGDYLVLDGENGSDVETFVFDDSKIIYF